MMRGAHGTFPQTSLQNDTMFNDQIFFTGFFSNGTVIIESGRKNQGHQPSTGQQPGMGPGVLTECLFYFFHSGDNALAGQ